MGTPRSGGPAGGTTDIDYETAVGLVAQSGLSASASEAHGILCGLICGGVRDPRQTWLDLIQPPVPAPEATDDAPEREIGAGLDDLARATLEQIHGPGVGFSLLLPDDDQPLAERATAVYDWVRGFLFALGAQGISERDLSSQSREIFRDFTDLTRMDLDALDEGEDNEDALSEITEFIWVAAMLVYEERVIATRERPRGSP